MPKKPTQDKESFSEKRSVSAYRRVGSSRRSTPKSLAHIMKSQDWLHKAKQVHADQRSWLEWFDQTLPVELRGSVRRVLIKGEELTILAASGGWSARLRYALDSLRPQLKRRAPDIVKISV